TFAETFAASNHPEDLKAYMDTAFDKATLQKELKNPQSMFAFIYQDAKLAGYLKINTEEAQTEPEEQMDSNYNAFTLNKLFLDKGLDNECCNIHFNKQRN